MIADAAPSPAVSDAAPAPDAALATLPHPFFWRLEKDGHTSYLLGTMHAGVSPLRLPPQVWQRLDEARVFAMETDVTGAPELYRHRPKRPPLDQALGPRYWKKLEEALGEARARAMLTDVPATPQGALASRTIPRTPAMDAELRAHAEAGGKRLVFLEPIEQPLALLERWITVRTLREAIDDATANDERMQAQVAAYLAGDGAALLELAAAERKQALAHGHSQRELDTRDQQMLYQRNAAWIEPIERLHASGGGFIAVGTAHTIGPGSLIELLERRGFTVTRIDNP